VPLVEKVEGGLTAYNWTTASHGAVYQFRVIAYYDRRQLSGRGHVTVGRSGGGSGRSADAVDNELLGMGPVASLPSAVVTFSTGDPMTAGSRRSSDLLIGGIVGGTAGTVVVVIAVIITVRLCRQWKQHKKALQSAQALSSPADCIEHEIHFENYVDKHAENNSCKMKTSIKETPI
jgi:hypothetical protein